ncbi:MAG: hypothetical protein ACYC0L_03010 [Thermoleophilia bacterium]
MLNSVRKQNPFILLLGVIVGCILFILFAWLSNHEDRPILDLGTNWIALMVFAVFVGLVVGGYIKKFEGFGFNFEGSDTTAFSGPLGIIDIPAGQEATENFQNIVLIVGPEGQSDREEIKKLIEQYPNVKYLLTKKKSGKFLSLIPVKEIKTNEKIDEGKLDIFVRALEEETELMNNFGDRAITTILRIPEHKNAIDAYFKMKEDDAYAAVFLSEEETYAARIVYRKDIADAMVSELSKAAFKQAFTE